MGRGPVQRGERLRRPANREQRGAQPRLGARLALRTAVRHQVRGALLDQRKPFVGPAGQAQQQAEPAAHRLGADLVTGCPVLLDRGAPRLLRAGQLPPLGVVVATPLGPPGRLVRRQVGGGEALVDGAPYRPRLGQPVRARQPLGQVQQLAGRTRGHGRRPLLPRRRPGHVAGQRSVLDQRLGGEQGGNPSTVVLRTVALVEAGGERAGGVGQLVREPADADLAGAAGHRQVAMAGPGEPAQQQRRGRGELHRFVRRGRPVQPVQVPLHDLQATRLVAGERAVRHVLADPGQVAQVWAQPVVRAAVRRGGLVQPPGTQVRQEQRGEHPVRLRHAAEPAGEHRLGQRHRLLVAAPRRQVLHFGGWVAAGAVGQLVPRRGAPARVPLVGAGDVAQVAGDRVPVRVDGVQAVPARAVAALHVVQHRVRPVQRDLRELGQRADHVLELPQQEVVISGATPGRVPVVLGQAPGEGEERLGRLAAVHVRRGRLHPRGEREIRPAPGVGLPDDLFQHGDLRRPVRQFRRRAQPATQLVLTRHDRPPGRAGRGTSR